VRLTLSQFAATGALLVRALPVVLLSVLVFFNTYVWVMSATISQTRISLAMGLLVLIAAVFVVTGTFERARPLLEKATASTRHTERLVGTPFEEMSDPAEPDSLTTGEWFNVIFVLAVTQIAQILMVAIVTASLFFVLGLIVLSPELLAAWTRNGASDGNLVRHSHPDSADGRSHVAVRRGVVRAVLHGEHQCPSDVSAVLLRPAHRRRGGEPRRTRRVPRAGRQGSNQRIELIDYRYCPRFDSVSMARLADELLPVTSVRM
jgi:hypothetical protein